MIEVVEKWNFVVRAVEIKFLLRSLLWSRLLSLLLFPCFVFFSDSGSGSSPSAETTFGLATAVEVYIIIRRDIDSI
jgi:hypothetical protein